jgi:hypothetical protein
LDCFVIPLGKSQNDIFHGGIHKSRHMIDIMKDAATSLGTADCFINKILENGEARRLK